MKFLKALILAGAVFGSQFAQATHLSHTKNQWWIVNNLCPKAKCTNDLESWRWNCSLDDHRRTLGHDREFPYVSYGSCVCPCAPGTYDWYASQRSQYNGAGTMRVTLVPKLESKAEDAQLSPVYHSIKLGTPQSEVENQLGVGESESLVNEADGSVVEIKSWSSHGSTFEAEFTNGSLTSKFLNRVFQD